MEVVAISLTAWAKVRSLKSGAAVFVALSNLDISLAVVLKVLYASTKSTIFSLALPVSPITEMVTGSSLEEKNSRSKPFTTSLTLFTSLLTSIPPPVLVAPRRRTRS